MDRGFGGRDRYDDRSRDYDRGRVFLKDCWGGEGEGEALPQWSPAWPSSPPVTGEGLRKMSCCSSSPGNFNPQPCAGSDRSPGLAQILRPLR